MKGYTSQDVARLLVLTVAQVRGFARDGFLTPPPGRGVRRKLQFSFQDLVILRTAKALVAARIPARRIRRALRRLRQQLPRGSCWRSLLKARRMRRAGMRAATRALAVRRMTRSWKENWSLRRTPRPGGGVKKPSRANPRTCATVSTSSLATSWEVYPFMPDN